MVYSLLPLTILLYWYCPLLVLSTTINYTFILVLSTADTAYYWHCLLLVLSTIGTVYYWYYQLVLLSTIGTISYWYRQLMYCPLMALSTAVILPYNITTSYCQLLVLFTTGALHYWCCPLLVLSPTCALRCWYFSWCYCQSKKNSQVESLAELLQSCYSCLED